MMKKSIIVLLLVSALLFCGCNPMQLIEEEDVRADAEEVMEAIEAEDSDYLYDTYFNHVEKDEFKAGMEQILDVYEGERLSMELYNVNVRNFTSTTKVVTYFIKTTKHPYTLTLTYEMQEGEEEYTLIGARVALFLNYVVNRGLKNYDLKTWVFFVINIVSYMLMILALILCIKTKIKKKPLWIILIILQVGISIVDFPNQYKFNFSIIQLLRMTIYALYAHGGTVTNVFIHIFAIIFLFLRKRLNKNYLHEQEMIKAKAEKEQILREEHAKKEAEKQNQLLEQKDNEEKADN